jgi:hypothetical protein
MAQMVDSQQEELSVEDIIGIDGMNTGSDMFYGNLVEQVSQELQNPNSLFIRQGNTLFIIQKTQSRMGDFRTINADTKNNFFENSRMFIEACYKMGFDVMETQVVDPSMLQVFRYISDNPPNPEIAYEVQQSEDGAFNVIIQCGPRRETEQ